LNSNNEAFYYFISIDIGIFIACEKFYDGNLMEYAEALVLVTKALYDLTALRVRPDTRIDFIMGVHPEIPGPFVALLREQTRISITEDQFIQSETVARLAMFVTSTSRQESRTKYSLYRPPNVTSPLFLEEPDDCNYPVWYGTNRMLDAAGGYAGSRDSRTHYGLCRVLVPRSHKIGSIGSSWWKRAMSAVDDRLRILERTELQVENYWQGIISALSAVELGDRDAVIFVHGYNVSFEDAAIRAAQIGFDLSIKGAMAFFSWPSQGTNSGYLADEASIEASEPAITQFVVDFATRSGAKSVHVIAHSMGNRGILRAINRIAGDAQLQSDVHFDQIILAAADVDTDLFRNLCGACGKVSRRATLYVSEQDIAVEASKWMHKFPRAGLSPPVCVVSGIDTISVTNVDMTLLGHGYVAESREVLQDIHDLIRRGVDPSRRFGLRPAETDSGDVFWVLA
jgi:esterase/lipase superfamily enzyme